MKRKQKQNIIIGIIGIIVVGITIAYFYSTDQARIKGFSFGNNLQSIQEDLKKLQTDFDSKVRIWKEGDMSADEFFEYSDKHITKMEKLIFRYDTLSPPDVFASSVELFKLSTQSQLESDKQFIEWLKTDDESSKIRSDALIQESFEYEMAALANFNEAKAGINP